MKEQPMHHQSGLPQSTLATRIEHGHLENHEPPTIATHLSGSRFGLKQPHFAITPAKLQEAALHRWKSATFVGLILAACGFGLAWATYAPKYTATSSMRMESGDRRLLPNNENRHANNEEEFRKTQSFMIRSHRVLNEVVKKHHIRAFTSIRKLKDPVLWLEKEIQASFISGTSILRVSLTGEAPEEIAHLVNEIMNVFKLQFVFAAKEEQDARYRVISAAVDSAEKRIEEKRAGFDNIAIMLRTNDPQTLTDKQRIALEEFRIVKKELFDLDSKTRSIVSQISVHRAALKSQENEQPPTALIDERIDQDNAVKQLQSELNVLKARLQEAKKTVATTSPLLMQYHAEFKSAEARLQKMRIDLYPDAVRNVRSDSQRNRIAAIDQATETLDVLAKQRAEVLKEVIIYGNEAGKIGDGTIELGQWRRQIEDTEVILKWARAEKERLDFEKLNSLPTISAESPAIVPTVNQASFLMSSSLYSVGGFLLGLLGVSFLEARLCRLHKPTEIQRELGIETLGAIPMFDQNRRRTYGRSLASARVLPNDSFTVAFNGLCATLLCDDRLKSKSAIMITSAGESEGKTLLATQLAISFARAGRRTLLLDCDFRRPCCHEQIGLSIGPGLSEILRGEVELEAALRSLPGSESQFLSAGVSDSRVIQSLSNGAFADLLTRLRADYDCIIVDSAPTLVVSDGLLIGKMVDGVILVVRSKVSKAPSVFSAYEQLSGLKIRILGAVVNGIRTHGSSYYAR